MLAPKPGVIIGLGVSMPPVVVVMVALRLISKSKSFKKSSRARRFTIDDYLIVLPTALLIVLCGFMITGTVRHGFGHQADTHTAEQGYNDQSPVLTRTKFYTDMHQWFYPFIFGLTKLSVLFFYRLIFRGRAFDIASWTLIVICTLWGLFAFFFDLFQCGPHVDWLADSAAVIATRCLNAYRISFSTALLDAVTDLFVLTLPNFWVWRLQMSFWRRASVCGIFMFGILTLASSAFRLAMFALVYPHHNSLADQLSYLTIIVYWENLEGGMCIIAACLMTLGPLLPRGFSSSATTLPYFFERVWGASARRNPPLQRRSQAKDSMRHGRLHSDTSRAQSNQGGVPANASQTSKKNNGQVTRDLVGHAPSVQGHTSRGATKSSSGTSARRTGDMDQDNVIVTRDVIVEHHWIGTAI